MTDEITVMRCARCRHPFSYTPSPDDTCAPGTERQICDACADDAMLDLWPPERKEPA